MSPAPVISIKLVDRFAGRKRAFQDASRIFSLPFPCPSPSEQQSADCDEVRARTRDADSSSAGVKSGYKEKREHTGPREWNTGGGADRPWPHATRRAAPRRLAGHFTLPRYVDFSVMLALPSPPARPHAICPARRSVIRADLSIQASDRIRRAIEALTFFPADEGRRALRALSSVKGFAGTEERAHARQSIRIRELNSTRRVR